MPGVNMDSAELKVLLKAVRTAVADYMSSEGCTCCQNIEAHQEHRAALGKLLHVKKYSDGSGYDFSKYLSDLEPQRSLNE